MSAEEFVYVEPFSTADDGAYAPRGGVHPVDADDRGLCVPFDDELSTVRGVVIGVLCGICFYILIAGLIVLLAVI